MNTWDEPGSNDAPGALLRVGQPGLPGAPRSASSATEAWQMLAGLLEAVRVMPTNLRAPDGSLPLTILSGFLGAGKTTLLNRLLMAPGGRRLAVLVNDFGRINIDAELVRSRTDDMISLTNGCVCCTVSSELTRTLIDLAQRPDPPDALVLEASGLADPRGIAQVALANPALRLDGVITLVDAASFDEPVSNDVAATIARQYDAADLFVLTKTDEADAARLSAVRQWLEKHYPAAPVTTSVNGDLPASVVLGLQSVRDPRRMPPAPWTHGDAFESWSLRSDMAIDPARLREFLEALSPRLLRVKGVLHLASDTVRRHVYQRVGRRASLVADTPWGDAVPGSTLVLIGPRGCVDGPRLQSEFTRLAATAMPVR